MRREGSRALAFVAVALGDAALVALIFCVRREAEREGRGPIYGACAVAAAAYVLMLAEHWGLLDMGVPLRAAGSVSWGSL